MIERIGHIKNPLTVIAMFAAIAEVSGTVVLPLVAEGVQSVYVWFLMFFPCFLVFLFFVTLWKDHSVLYAPSDYQTDQSFIDAKFRLGSGYVELGAVMGGSVVEEPVPDIEPEAGVSDEDAGLANSDSSVGQDFGIKNESIPAQAKSTKKSSAHSRLVLKVAEHQILRDLSKSLQGTYKGDVEPKGLGSVKFGGVIESTDKIVVVNFIKAAQTEDGLKLSLLSTLTSATAFWGTLSHSDQERFKLHVAFMATEELSEESQGFLAGLSFSMLSLPLEVEACFYICSGEGYSKRTMLEI